MTLRRIAFIGLAPSLFAWVGYLLLGHKLAVWMGQRWGQQLVRAGDGKFSDAAIFLQHRFYEGTWLLTFSVLTLIAILGFGALMARRLPQLWKWVPYTVTGFLGINVWLKVAGTTCLFWCLFWNGKGTTDNFTQFHIKLRLMDENPAPVKVVLGGSSQAHAQIDPRILNRQLLPEVFTTELHFPGNRGYDFLSLDQELEGHKVDIILCYLSEGNFYGDTLSGGFPFFFTFQDWPEFHRLGGKLSSSPQSAIYALWGSLLPVFRLRDCITQRFLGDSVGLRLAQMVWDHSADIHERALQAAAPFRTNAMNKFHVQGFEAFVARCHAQNRMVVFCWGQLNPILAREIDPTLRPRIFGLLKDLAAKYDNVVLLDQNQLPVQTEADYEDLTHATREAQIRYTEAFSPILGRLATQSKRRDAKH